MGLTFGFHPIALLAALVAAGVFTAWSYQRSVPRVNQPLHGLLIGLRFFVLALILALLFEPVIRYLDELREPPVLVVLVDGSESITLKEDDQGVDVAAAMRSALRAVPADDLPGEVRFVLFDEGLASAGTEFPTNVDSVQFSGSRTDIALSLEQVLERHREENLRGVLLLSDGRYNTGRNPLYVADQYPVPIHTVVVGDTTKRRDVQVRRVTTNEIAYLGVQLPIEVGLRATGFEDEPATVTLFRNEELVSSTPVTLPQSAAEVQVDLSFVPEAPGLHRLTVAVTQFEGEITYANNTETVTVQVLESKRRILVVAAAAGPDLASLLRTMSADKDIELTVRTLKNPGVFYEGDLPADLQSFDVVILVGYPGSGEDRRNAERVAEAVAGGVPLLFLMGRRTDFALLADVFGPHLPVRPTAVRRGFLEASLDITPTGEIHPILQIPDSPPEAWRVLPPILYNESLWQARPDARVLATIRVRGVGLDDPLFVVHRQGNRRSAAWLGAGTWRWSNLADDLRAVEVFWPEVLSNLIRWTTSGDDDRPVRVDPTRSLFGGGEPVQFSGQVYDESLLPVTDASVEVTIFDAENREYDHVMDPIGNGRYVLDVGPLPEGSYRYSAQASRAEADLGSDRGGFAVGRLTIEFKETQADAPLMGQLARRSGGLALHAEALGRLAEQLDDSGSFDASPVEVERVYEVWKNPWLLLILVVSLTAEWVIRKRSGMV